MQFGFLGVNYKDAQLAVRDKTSFTDAMKLAFFQKAEIVGIEQCMVLSTCNRSEVFYFYEQEIQTVRIRKIYVSAGRFVGVSSGTGWGRGDGISVSDCSRAGISGAGGRSDFRAGEGSA